MRTGARGGDARARARRHRGGLKMPEWAHDFRLPGECEEYRQARTELLQAEMELRRQVERVAAQRRALPLGGGVQTDYEFQEWDMDRGAARPVRFSELFAPGKDTLFLYS